jgi:uncharacterized membrane protein
MTSLSPAASNGDRGARRFTLISLALNLFFIGIAATLFVRYYTAAPSVVTFTIDRRPAARIERIAATLPPADAAIMRAAYRDNAATLDASRSDFEDSVSVIRQTFRTEPYDIEATRKAMNEARAKRQHFDELLHGAIATAAARMSHAGRVKLAEYSSARITTTSSR